MLQQVYDLLTKNYVEDDDNMFRCEVARDPCGTYVVHLLFYPFMLLHRLTHSCKTW